MRNIRFRVQGSDSRWLDAFGNSLAVEIPQILTQRGWQVITPVTIIRPAGWTGLWSVVFDFRVAVYDSYANNYATNEAIKEQLRRDLSPILNIDWIVMPEIGGVVAQDTGGFIFDQANTQAAMDAAKAVGDALAGGVKAVGEAADDVFPVSMIILALLAMSLLVKR